jgi:hypothetical protein
MELPVFHAPAHAGASAAGIALADDAPPHELRPGGATQPAGHDPASCVVCRSLHAKPALAQQGGSPRPLPERTLGHHAPAQRAHACAAQSGHPPRAPPLAPLSLA